MGRQRKAPCVRAAACVHPGPDSGASAVLRGATRCVINTPWHAPLSCKFTGIVRRRPGYRLKSWKRAISCCGSDVFLWVCRWGIMVGGIPAYLDRTWALVLGRVWHAGYPIRRRLIAATGGIARVPSYTHVRVHSVKLKKVLERNLFYKLKCDCDMIMTSIWSMIRQTTYPLTWVHWTREGASTAGRGRARLGCS